MWTGSPISLVMWTSGPISSICTAGMHGHSCYVWTGGPISHIMWTGGLISVWISGPISCGPRWPISWRTGGPISFVMWTRVPISSVCTGVMIVSLLRVDRRSY